MTTAIPTVRGAVTRWIDPEFPGWVQVVFTEANGNTVAVVDKLPVLGVDADDTTAFPFDADIDCEVLREDGDVAVVRLLDHVADETELHLPTKSLRR
jgi:hypothetical protein